MPVSLAQLPVWGHLSPGASWVAVNESSLGGCVQMGLLNFITSAPWSFRGNLFY